MTTTIKTIPAGTKIYASLANCCRHQSVRPGGVQPVFNAADIASQNHMLQARAIGFAALPEREAGVYITWTR